MIFLLVLALFLYLYYLQRPITLMLYRMSDIRSISKAINAKKIIVEITQSSRVEVLRQASNWDALIASDSARVISAYRLLAKPCHVIDPDLNDISNKVTLLMISIDKYYTALNRYLSNENGGRSIELLAKVNHSICRIRLESNAISRTLATQKQNIKSIKFYI
jgi:hypothetical protein